MAICCSFVIDSWYYSCWTLTPYNFVKQNVWNSISLFYGSMPWHYYFSQGLPVIGFNLLPYVLYDLCLSKAIESTRSSNKQSQLLGCCISLVLAYSLLHHKEMRFILPLAPILHIFAARTLLTIQAHPRRSLRRHVVFLFITSVIPLIFGLRFHDRGKTQVIDYLRNMPSSEQRSVAFLTPCHSTPWQSHLHRPELEEVQYDGSGNGGRLWFLSCEPPVLWV